MYSLRGFHRRGAGCGAGRRRAQCDAGVRSPRQGGRCGSGGIRGSRLESAPGSLRRVPCGDEDDVVGHSVLLNHSVLHIGRAVRAFILTTRKPYGHGYSHLLLATQYCPCRYKGRCQFECSKDSGSANSLKFELYFRGPKQGVDAIGQNLS
jgi:hypothetical protein